MVTETEISVVPWAHVAWDRLYVFTYINIEKLHSYFFNLAQNENKTIINYRSRQ